MKMIRIDIRGGIDLERVIVLVCVLEQTVHRIEDLKSVNYSSVLSKFFILLSHLMGHCEEPLSRHAPVVKALLSSEDDVQSPPQLVSREPHDLVE